MEAKGPAGSAVVSRQGGDGLVCLRFGVEMSSIHNYTEAAANLLANLFAWQQGSLFTVSPDVSFRLESLHVIEKHTASQHQQWHPWS